MLLLSSKVTIPMVMDHTFHYFWACLATKRYLYEGANINNPMNPVCGFEAYNPHLCVRQLGNPQNIPLNRLWHYNPSEEERTIVHSKERIKNQVIANNNNLKKFMFQMFPPFSPSCSPDYLS